MTTARLKREQNSAYFTRTRLPRQSAASLNVLPTPHATCRSYAPIKSPRQSIPPPNVSKALVLPCSNGYRYPGDGSFPPLLSRVGRRTLWQQKIPRKLVFVRYCYP